MARSVKAAEYERRSRLRKLYDVQASLLGWTKLDVLSAFITDDGQVVVYDKNESRHSGPALPEAVAPVPIRPAIVSPLDLGDEDFGPRWQAGREKIGARISALDLTETRREDALQIFEELAAVSLRAVELLREHNAPDWQERVGLSITP